MEKECIFCKIARGEIKADVVCEDAEMVAFKDINPKAPVHLLFIPKKHISSIDGMDARDADIVGRIFLKIKDVARENGITEGYRVVANTGKGAGQEVFHAHFHLLGGRKFTWPPG